MSQGWGMVNLVGDNTSSLFQIWKLRGGVGLLSQQRLLRQIVYLLGGFKIRVFLHWVRSEMMPADPVSRHLENFDSNLAEAEKESRNIFRSLREGGGYEEGKGEIRYVGYVGEHRRKPRVPIE